MNPLSPEMIKIRVTCPVSRPSLSGTRACKPQLNSPGADGGVPRERQNLPSECPRKRSGCSRVNWQAP